MLKNSFLLAVVIASVVLVPIFVIMSINTLFNTNIDLTLETWLASFFLTLVFKPASASVLNSDRKG